MSGHLSDDPHRPCTLCEVAWAGYALDPPIWRFTRSTLVDALSGHNWLICVTV